MLAWKAKFRQKHSFMLSLFFICFIASFASLLYLHAYVTYSLKITIRYYCLIYFEMPAFPLNRQLFYASFSCAFVWHSGVGLGFQCWMTAKIELASRSSHHFFCVHHRPFLCLQQCEFSKFSTFSSSWCKSCVVSFLPNATLTVQQQFSLQLSFFGESWM